MNFLDVILIIPLIYGVWCAFHKGLIMSLLTVLALIIGIYVAFHFSNFFSHFISEHFYESMPKNLPAISFLIVFLIVGVCIYFGGKALEKIVKIVRLSFLNKLFGALLGLVKWGYFLSCLLIFIESMDSNEQVLSKDLKSNSFIYPILKKLIPNTIPNVTNTALYKHIEISTK